MKTRLKDAAKESGESIGQAVKVRVSNARRCSLRMPSLPVAAVIDNPFYVLRKNATDKKLIIVRRPLRLSRSAGSFLADRFARSHGYRVNSGRPDGDVEKKTKRLKKKPDARQQTLWTLW
ncbi:MAG: hypothetical protein IPG58_11315 [Acidobacteria bacterium]|nr:hypothetical protein [Acidobacteriota bacterium]